MSNTASTSPYFLDDQTTENEAIRLGKSCLVFMKNEGKGLKDFSAFKRKLLPINSYSEIPERFEHLKEYGFYTTYRVFNSFSSGNMITLGINEVALTSRIVKQCHISYEEKDIRFNPVSQIFPDFELTETKVEEFYTPRKSHRKITKNTYCGAMSNISVTDAKVRAVYGSDLQQTGLVIKNYPQEGALQPPIRHILITNSPCDTPAE